MFDRTLSSSWNDRSRRGLTTLTSLGIQALAVAMLLVLPLLRPQGLPSFHQLSTPISLGQSAAEAPENTARAATDSTTTDTASTALRLPARIPKGIPRGGDDAVPQIGIPGSGIPGTQGGDPAGVAHLFDSGLHPIVPVVRPPIPVAPLRLRRSGSGVIGLTF